jgi:hypothetical protein
MRVRSFEDGKRRARKKAGPPLAPIRRTSYSRPPDLSNKPLQAFTAYSHLQRDKGQC